MCISCTPSKEYVICSTPWNGTIGVQQGRDACVSCGWWVFIAILKIDWEWKLKGDKRHVTQIHDHIKAQDIVTTWTVPEATSTSHLQINTTSVVILWGINISKIRDTPLQKPYVQLYKLYFSTLLWFSKTYFYFCDEPCINAKPL